MAIAAESNMFEALKMIPPKNALPMLTGSACIRSGIKLRPSEPILPKVKAEITENKRTPIT